MRSFAGWGRGIIAAGALTSHCGAATYPAQFQSPQDIPISSAGFTAAGHSVDLSLNFTPTHGTNLTVVNNTDLDFITGTFSNLAQGQVVELVHAGVSHRFIANYFGGTGNDLVLQWAATRLVAWGDNFYGELGTGNTLDRELAVPVTVSPVLAGQTVVAAAAGPSHSLALRADGRVIAWGGNSYGALGDATTASRLQPVAVEVSGQLAGRTIVAVDAGFCFSAALASDGRVFTWGFNSEGQLGNGTTNITANPLPVAVNTTGLLVGRKVVAIAAGYSHMLALCSDGTLATWGDNTYHQLGDGTTTSSSVPVAVDTSGVLAGKSVVAIAAASYHNLALCSDGTLVSWGANDAGVLGNGTTTPSSVPVAVDASGVLAGKSVASITAGISHSLVVCSDGTLAAWGSNGAGMLGDGTTTNRSVPVEVDRSGVLAGKSVLEVQAGGGFSLARCTDGSIAAWGAYSDGRLGFGTLEDSEIPNQVSTEPMLAGEVFLAANSGTNAAHTLAITALPPTPLVTVESGGRSLTHRGSICNFGSVVAGEQIPLTLTLHNSGIVPLVIGGIAVEGRDATDFSLAQPTPATIPAGGGADLTVTFTSGTGFERRATLRISTNDPFTPEFTCGLSATVRGTLQAGWSSPGAVPLTVAGFAPAGSTVNLALTHTPVTGAALKLIENTGSGNTEGEFDNLAQGQQVTLIHQAVTYHFVADYFGGDGNDLVLRWADTRLFSWGANSESQLGDGGTTTRILPHPAALSGSSTLIGVEAGATTSFARMADGTLRAWGNNFNGQLGIGGNSNQAVPAPVDSSGVLAGRKVVAVSAGQDHTLALCSDGTLAGWGENLNGQLGLGTTSLSNPSPLAVPMAGALAGKRVIALATGQSHSLALCTDGSIASWGDNWRGELGNGGSLVRSTPVAVSTKGVLAGKRVIAIAAGNDHSLALCDDGSLAAWGDNSEGQLGDGSTEHRRVPVAVDASGALAGKQVIAIAAGLYHSLALCSDGTVVAWGANSNGQLGVSGTASRPSPVVVGTAGAQAGRTVIGIATYRSGSLARCSDGSLIAWGSNSSGEHGVGFTNSSSSPIPERASTSTLVTGGLFVGISSGPLPSHLLGIAAMPPDPAMQLEAPDGAPLVPGNSTVSFPASLAGASPNQTLTVRNLQGGPLVITGISFEGLDPADFIVSRPPLGAVHAGNTTTFQIAFSPSAAGPREAVMRIQSNDPAGPFTVMLAGTAGTATDLQATYLNGAEIPLSTQGFTATGKQVAFTLGFGPPVGTRLTVIENTSPGMIDGRFGNLIHGQEITLIHQGAAHTFVADYYGGDGNDLVLVPARGRLLSWGANSSGGLGNGTTLPGLVPAAVQQRGILLGKTILATATGGSHSLALCSDGTVAAWGLNTNGQLGNGNTTASMVPVAVDLDRVLAGRRVVALAAGSSFSLALCADGSLAAWGLNSSGQLGNGTTATSTTPVLVDTSGILAGKPVVAISAGAIHCLALCRDGTLASWGNNGSGRLGNGTTAQSSSPVAVDLTGALAGKQVTAISAGASHSLALCADGTVSAWGANTHGELGRGNTTSSPLPILVSTADALDGKIVTAIAAGNGHSLAMTRAGGLVSWGDNTYLQLAASGISSSITPIPVPASGALAGREIVAIHAGASHSAARCTDGSLVAWGRNSSGQLGINDLTSTATPALVDTRLTIPGVRFMNLATGSAASHNLVVVDEPPAPRIVIEYPDGTELANAQGTISFPLADVGGTVSRSVTIRNAGTADLSDFSVAFEGTGASLFHVIALPAAPLAPGAAGTLELGFTPSAVGPRQAIVRIGSNDPLSLVFDIRLSGDGRGEMIAALNGPPAPAAEFESLAAIGSTIRLSLNHTPSPGSILPVIRITGPHFIAGTFDNLPQGQEVTFNFSGRDHSFVANYYGGDGNDLVLHPAGARTLAWGLNFSGQLGTGNSTQQALPVETVATGILAGRTVFALAAGERHSLALCSDGSLAAWGNNNYGQLGRGSSGSSTSPVAVSMTGILAGKQVAAIAAGAMHSMALCSDGTAATWGRGTSGQLGNDTTGFSNSPVAVTTSGILAGKTIVAIAAGAYHNLALCSDGSLASWGDNTSGQLGNGNTTQSSVPVAVNQSGVLAGKTIVAIAAGTTHSLALCDDGSIAAWGDNFYGALGDGTNTNRSLPVLVTASGVLSGRSVTSISGGDNFSLALCSDGFLAAWGSNADGKLGDGTTATRFFPVAVNTSGVLSGATILKIAAFASHAVATCTDGTLAAWGQNGSGRLGDGTTVASSVPIRVSSVSPPPGGAFVMTALGGCSASHSLAIQVETPRIFFESWTAAHGLDGSPGKESGFSDDPDHDGIVNGLEWILMGNPLSQDASSRLAVTGSATSGLTLVFSRVPESLGADLQLEWETDLADGFSTSMPIGRVDRPASGNNPQIDVDAPQPGMVTITIPAANATQGRIFARLKALVP